LDWTASQHEGVYEIEVTVRDTTTGATGSTILAHQMISLAGPAPVITPTQNPLVFLYSAPPCRPPSRMRVEFESPEGFIQDTPNQDCSPGLSMNFYLAGLRASATYAVHHIIESGLGAEVGPTLTLTTPPLPVQLPVAAILQSAPSPPVDGVWLYSNLFGPSFATDSNGSVIWYYPARFALLTRPESGGRFLAVVANQPAAGFGQTLREFDVAGNTLRETNTTDINEQLAAMGKPAIGVFHHDALGLPDGELLVLATTEQILTGAQGPGPVDIIGDMILLLDQDLQVVWTWNAFDHLDVHRAATLGETCPGLGCPPISLASHANDWLHGNALQLTADGNLLYSTRHQDWIIKIDFGDGLGTGDVIWRLGKDGDFQIDSSDPSPWFSHQHGPQLAPQDPTLLAIFDDSNLRQSIDKNAHSRAQVLQLDEPNRIASLRINADAGGFSFAVGNAQPLLDGNYHFCVGWLPDNSSRSLELDPSGGLRSAVNVNAPQYRSFRMHDLYTPDADRTVPSRNVRQTRGFVANPAGSR
jgi:arylsulfate sulfotransferase